MGKYYTLRFFKYCIWLMFCHMYRQILLPWQMLLPMFCGRCCCLGRCYCHIYYIILSDRCYSHFVITLADVIALWYVIDVKTTIVACYNSWWAGVICQVADGIATVGWMYMLDGISIGRWNSQGSVQFSLSSEVLNKTSSYICDRWNLPMFLLRDGLLTLINNVSWIALLRFWSSLLTILILSMLMLWPVLENNHNYIRSNRMRNLHVHIRSEYGIENVKLFWQWENIECKMANFQNHRRFSLRCLNQDVVPVSSRLKSHVKRPRGLYIIKRAERSLLNERIRSTNNMINILIKLELL